MKRQILFLLLVATSVSVNADCILRQSDAGELKLGPFVDSTDGVTPETALTISQADVQIAKCAAAGDCGAFAQKNDTGACAHDAGGMYECDYNATDVDTVGILEILVEEAGALPVFKTCQVLDTAPFDRDYADAATGIVGTAQTGDSFARLGAPAGASLSADMAAVKTDTGTALTRIGTPSNLGGGATLAANNSDIEAQTDDIGAAGAGLTALASQSSVNTIDDFLDTEMAAVKAVTDKLDDTVEDQGGGVFGFTEAALQEAPTGGGGVTDDDLGIAASGTAQGGTASSIQLADATNKPDNYFNCMTVFLTGGTGAGQSRAIESDGWDGDTDTASITPDWTTNPSSDSTYNVFGTACASGGGGGGLDAAGVRAAVGLASPNLDTQLGGIDDAVDTEVAAIKTKTDFLPSATAGSTGGLFIAGTNAATTITTALTTTFTGNLTGNVGGTVNGLTSTAQGNMRTALGMSSANLDTQLSGLSSAIAVIDGIVDQLLVGVNVSQVNGEDICGTGDSGTPWSGCP